jgi:hypothetical protein
MAESGLRWPWAQRFRTPMEISRISKYQSFSILVGRLGCMTVSFG